MQFTEADVRDQSGKTFLITGSNTGLGFEAARVIAGAGGHVILACRNPDKAQAAMARIRELHPDASVEHLALDLADLDSVRAASAQVLERNRLDCVVNNAGVMMPPLGRTRQGFEQQFGINHLGHFAFNALILPKLLDTPGARLVITSSIAHRQGKIRFDDLNAERSYSRTDRYNMSKLANLLYLQALLPRIASSSANLLVLGVHPGVSFTDLTRHFPRFIQGLIPFAGWLGSTPAEGAWSTLLAATEDNLEHGAYYGPKGWLELKGPAGPVGRTRQSRDVALAERLWTVSEELTGITFTLP